MAGATPQDLAAAELALLLASTELRRDGARERLCDLYDGAEDAHLSAFLEERRVLTTLGTRLNEYCDTGPEFREALHRSLEEARARGALQEMITLDLATQLERHEIRCLTLKGATLSRSLYGDPGMRGASDIDLLVNRQDLWAASEVVRSRGYSPRPSSLAPGQLPLLHLEFVDQQQHLPRVEIHWRVHWYEEAFAEQMLARSGADGPHLRRARPEDELVSLLLFYARDGFVGMRLAADIAQWWDRFGGDLGAASVQQTASTHPKLGPSLRASSKVAGDVLGLPVQALCSQPLGHTRERLAVRLANWPALGHETQVAANLALIDGLLAPPGDWIGFMRRQLLPDQPETSTALHASKMLMRFAIALWAVRGGRSWVPPG